MTRNGTRRQFVKALAVTPLATGMAAAGQAADADARAAAARALTDLARARFPYLNEEQLKQVRGAIAGDLAGLEALQRVSLTNADEPDFIFPLETSD